MDVSHAIDGFAALAQPTRLRVFRLLMTAGPDGLRAGELAERLAIPHNTLSTHLGLLVHAGLLGSRREGRVVQYAIDLDGTRRLVDFLVADCCNGRPELCAPIADALAKEPCC